MARLLQQRDGRGGGSGGALRLQLYLSLLWVCIKPPFSTERPARVWAQLLGLEDPTVNGTRRVRAALAELAARGFVTVEKGANTRASLITLLSDDGSGAPYTVPGEALSELADDGSDESTSIRSKHVYFRVPNIMWTEGLFGKLDGASTAMLVILLAESRGLRGPVWFSPSHADEFYGLAAATRAKGLQRLASLGFVSVSKENIRPASTFSPKRNVYSVNLLENRPAPFVVPTTGRASLLGVPSDSQYPA
jgi:hypothetical protein